MVDSLAGSAAGGVVAADTNAVHAFFEGKLDEKIALFPRLFEAGRIILPPPVLSEALSDPTLPIDKAVRICALPILQIQEGYWKRAGMMRAWLKRQGYKGALGDCLIAQACIDSRVPLITYDRDFRHFSDAGLILI